MATPKIDPKLISLVEQTAENAIVVELLDSFPPAHIVEMTEAKARSCARRAIRAARQKLENAMAFSVPR